MAGKRDWKRYERNWRAYERFRKDEVELFFSTERIERSLISTTIKGPELNPYTRS